MGEMTVGGKPWWIWILALAGVLSLFITANGAAVALGAKHLFDFAALFVIPTGFVVVAYTALGAGLLLGVMSLEAFAYKLYAAFLALNVLYVGMTLATSGLVALILPIIVVGILYANRHAFEHCTASLAYA